MKKYIKGLDVSLPYDKQDKDDVIRQVCCIIDNWPTLTPPNEPLTLAELREMDGKPVYVVIDDGFEPLKMWALVDYIKEEQCLTLTNNLGGRSQYYTADDLEIDHITAYRCPPEG
nr:hypothetical protein [uncultured Agathobaculum sp.]